MSMTTPETEPAKKENGFKFFAATLFLVGIVAAGAQFAAASTNGISEYVTLGSPTGPGLIAIIAGIVMGAKCRSWESWRKWIWLPLVVAVTLMFVVMGFTAQSIAREEAEIRQEEEERQAEVAQACQDLQQRMDAKAAEIDASAESRRRQAEAQDDPSWDGPVWDGIDRSPGLPEIWDRKEYDRLRTEYDASC